MRRLALGLFVASVVLGTVACSSGPDILHESACQRLDLHGRAVAGTFFTGPGKADSDNAANWLGMVQDDELSREIEASRFGDELAEYRESVWHALDATRAGGEWDDPGQLLQTGQSLWEDWDCSEVDGPTEWATASVTSKASIGHQ